jgi:hypothetical protein
VARRRLGIVGESAMTKALRQARRYRECREAGTHPTDSGEREDRLLGGQKVVMAKCAGCGTLYPADEA